MAGRVARGVLGHTLFRTPGKETKPDPERSHERFPNSDSDAPGQQVISCDHASISPDVMNKW